MAKIQEPDKSAMDRLYAKAAGVKKAADDKEGIVTDTAFKDHEEYVDTLDSLLASSEKESWDPNDPILD